MLPFLLAFLLAGAGRVSPTPGRNPGGESLVLRGAIRQGIFTDGRLWLITDEGDVLSLGEGESEARWEELPGLPRALCVLQGQPAAVVVHIHGNAPPISWEVVRRKGPGWETLATVPDQPEGPIGIACEGPTVTLVAPHRLVTIKGGQQHSVPLEPPLRGSLTPSFLWLPPYLYLGANLGEWGGGLWRIDPATGHTAPVESKVGDGICAGPLNGECDPVQALAPEPAKPGCLVAAVGLVHMGTEGRLLEVCGDKVQVLAESRYGNACRGERGAGQLAQRAGEHESRWGTVPFFGLVPQADALWAVGLDGLYRVRGGVAERLALPAFQQVSGVSVSYAPRWVLVLTDVSRRASVSGEVPLMVPR